jgi:hypothetical protein
MNRGAGQPLFVQAGNRPTAVVGIRAAKVSNEAHCSHSTRQLESKALNVRNGFDFIPAGAVCHPRRAVHIVRFSTSRCLFRLQK